MIGGSCIFPSVDVDVDVDVDVVESSNIHALGPSYLPSMNRPLEI